MRFDGLVPIHLNFVIILRARRRRGTHVQKQEKTANNGDTQAHAPTLGLPRVSQELADKEEEMRGLGVRVRLVVNLHQLANGSVRIPLRRRERLVPQQLLNGAQVGPATTQGRAKSVTQRTRMATPFSVDSA